MEEGAGDQSVAFPLRCQWDSGLRDVARSVDVIPAVEYMLGVAIIELISDASRQVRNGMKCRRPPIRGFDSACDGVERLPPEPAASSEMLGRGHNADPDNPAKAVRADRPAPEVSWISR